MEKAKTVAEGAGAMALAALELQQKHFKRKKVVVVILDCHRPGDGKEESSEELESVLDVVHASKHEIYNPGIKSEEGNYVWTIPMSFTALEKEYR